MTDEDDEGTLNFEDRAERLGKSRKKSADNARRKAADRKREESETPATPATPEADESKDDAPKPSVKDVYDPFNSYIPLDLKRMLKLRYRQASVEVEMATGEDGDPLELEKNRHWYPLVIKAGLDALEDVDGEGLAERARELEERTHSED
ncbi:hypothetical protein [Halomarina oriensis]|uniref:DUF8160 domain-containing protein n=1 Tax=Halomarina oriensis TaxID=671145 RepID=A0A6B0GEJ2_9EURY|nr:hypothetical protein [Halomarina oriensis]MWG33134.1 hypothetical protein [Halomarina oriensis]